MKDIVILGSGGLAKEVAFLIRDINRVSPVYNLLGFIDSYEKQVPGGKIAGNDDWLMNYGSTLCVAIGIGNPLVTGNLIDKFLENNNLEFPNLVHPKSIGDWDNIRFGKGNIICAGNIFTTDIDIGSFNIFNLSCTVGHDARIGNFNVINPSVNLSGGILMGDHNMVGTGAQLLQYLSVGSEITIGAGAVVTKNLTEPGTYVGMPARKLG